MPNFEVLRPANAAMPTGIFPIRERNLPFHKRRLVYSSGGALRDQTQRAVASVSYILDSKFNIPDKLLYHYTKFDSFESIVKTGELWASHYSAMNDFDELEHAWHILCLQSSSHLKEGGRHSHEYQEIRSIIFSDIDFYILSFTSGSNLLSQWRAYAFPKGVAISFPEGMFSSLADRNEHVLFGPVVYDELKKAEIIDPLAKRVADLLNAGLSLDELKKRATELKPEFLTKAPFLKNAGFFEEEELRLVILNPECGILEREGQYGRIRYIPVSYKQLFRDDPRQDFCIYDVVTSPTSNPDRSVKDANTVLSLNKAKFNVIFSCGISFRS